jgi:drug/metabolite transporter (DMT)-like permease
MPDEIMGAIIALFAPFAFAGAAIFIRLGLQRGFQPTTGTMVSLLSGWVFIAIFAVIFFFDEFRSLRPTDFAWFLLGGFTGFVMGRVLLFHGIGRLGVGRSYAIYSTYPLYATAISIAFLGEQMSALIAIGTIACFTGVALTVTARVSSDVAPSTQNSRSTNSPSEPAKNRSWLLPQRFLSNVKFIGFVAAFGSALSYGVNTVISRTLVTQIASPLVTATFTLLFGALVLFMLLGKRAPRDIKSASGTSLILIGLSGWCMSAGVLLVYSALWYAPVTIVGPLSSLSPLIAIFLSKVFLRDIEQITLRIILATCVVVGGVIAVVMGAST